MSYESESERIERLEDTVESLAKFQRDLLPALNMMNKAIAEIGVSSVNMVEAVRNENLVAWRYIQSAVVFVNPADRQKFLDVLARMETQMDFALARQNAVIAQIQKIISAPTPPDPEGAPES